MHIFSELGKKSKSNSAPISHDRKLLALSQQHTEVNENLSADQKEM